MVMREYLVCVDSDGCAMDTMNSKHEQCFGPVMISMWGLTDQNETVQKEWNRVNLFSETRGINRFLALELVLKNIGMTESTEDFAVFQKWLKETKELSQASLKAWTESHASETCRKALEWSRQVNEKISQMPKEGNKAFDGVRQVLARIHEIADVCIVSSANRGAVEEEWTREGLLDHVDVLMTQENGSKKDCIKAILERGYKPEHVLMVGDAPGDLEAARFNGVSFYPILAGRESESWEKLYESALISLMHGSFGDGAELEEQFYRNLERLAQTDQ